MQKISAIIPTGNEEHNIIRAIKSVDFADEIIVVDSFSDDSTIELAKPLATKILQRQYQNSASQKNWAIPQAKHEWILLLDADERITPALAQEIKDILSVEPTESGFWIYRQNHFMGKKVRFSGWQDDKVIRLFKRDECRYEEKKVHAEIISKGKLGYLKNKMYHYTFNNMQDYLYKIRRYAEWQSKDYDHKTGMLTPYHFVIKPIARFTKHYLLQLGILDGITGLAIASIQAYAVFLRYAKLWQLRRKS